MYIYIAVCCLIVHANSNTIKFHSEDYPVCVCTYCLVNTIVTYLRQDCSIPYLSECTTT